MKSNKKKICPFIGQIKATVKLIENDIYLKTSCTKMYCNLFTEKHCSSKFFH